jgi:hypothetical protein
MSNEQGVMSKGKTRCAADGDVRRAADAVLRRGIGARVSNIRRYQGAVSDARVSSTRCQTQRCRVWC